MSLHTAKLRKSTNSGIISAATAALPNEARYNYFIQNLGTNPLFVKEGLSASTTDFTCILGASGVQDDGSGGSISCGDDGIWTGAITVAGTSPRYTITERAESV